MAVTLALCRRRSSRQRKKPRPTSRAGRVRVVICSLTSARTQPDDVVFTFDLTHLDTRRRLPRVVPGLNHVGEMPVALRITGIAQRAAHRRSVAHEVETPPARPATMRLCNLADQCIGLSEGRLRAHHAIVVRRGARRVRVGEFRPLDSLDMGRDSEAIRGGRFEYFIHTHRTPPRCVLAECGHSRRSTEYTARSCTAPLCFAHSRSVPS